MGKVWLVLLGFLLIFAGICFGLCRFNSPNLSPSEGVSFASAFGEHNEVSMDEFLPNVVGLVGLTAVIVLGVLLWNLEMRTDILVGMHCMS